MPNYSSITIIGHLGRDPELQYNDKGNAQCRFSVAVNDKRRDEDVTMWFNCTAWGRTAEVCNQYLRKGSAVMISGGFSHREYIGRDEQQRTSLDIRVQDMQMLGGRDEQQGNQQGNQQSAPDTGDIPW